MALRPDVNNRDFNELEDAIHDILKGVYTAIPGEVLTYDDETRRARVRPSLRRRDGDQIVDRPPVNDVPVVWPGADGVTAHGRLKEGDEVSLVYSMRGYRAFLETHEPAAQDLDGFLGPAHPFAVPRFGRVDPLVAPRGGFKDGFTIQSDDGVLASRIDLEAGIVETINGTDVRSQHAADRIVHEVGSTQLVQTAGGFEFIVGGLPG